MEKCNEKDYDNNKEEKNINEKKREENMVEGKMWGENNENSWPQGEKGERTLCKIKRNEQRNSETSKKINK